MHGQIEIVTMRLTDVRSREAGEQSSASWRFSSTELFNHLLWGRTGMAKWAFRFFRAYSDL